MQLFSGKLYQIKSVPASIKYQDYLVSAWELCLYDWNKVPLNADVL